MAKNEEKRKASYEALNAYIEEHHHLPDKHKIENRGLLNWATTSHRSDLQGMHFHRNNIIESILNAPHMPALPRV